MYFLIMLMLLTFSSVLSENNSSNSKGVGKGLSLPYTCDFESADVFNTWTIIDANADGKTWMGVYSVNPKTARCAYNISKDADDWLISPAIALEAGKKYRLTFDTKSYNRLRLESMKVFYGMGTTVEAQTTLLADYPAIPAIIAKTDCPCVLKRFVQKIKFSVVALLSRSLILGVFHREYLPHHRQCNSLLLLLFFDHIQRAYPCRIRWLSSCLLMYIQIVFQMEAA